MYNLENFSGEGLKFHCPVCGNALPPPPFFNTGFKGLCLNIQFFT